eukprot:NODE_1234_length_2055_cov_34.912008_g1043_i0.p1 GENE.NODE_1234_length_2055_cov_34.912008_g1043_i0~~NODE_1234_length_2055_cov_34.912008_g1043_i0.p1  ORF type:complete len:181 (-),score=20.94 NODE_1234_length_2055_cov_34.912008_g1043_i0:25-567(-)
MKYSLTHLQYLNLIYDPMNPSILFQCFTLTAKQNGIMTALIFWIELEMEKNINWGPHNDDQCYLKNGVIYFPEIELKKGSKVSIKAEHNAIDLNISLIDFENTIPIDKDRYDPQWKEQNTKMDEIGVQLRSRMSFVSDYNIVSKTAIKIASQPTYFGVDPEMANRFALSLFLPDLPSEDK